MKTLTIILLSLFLSGILFGQTDLEIIRKANDLIANKKYERAFTLLKNFDPKNEKTDIVLLKEDIVLNYFVSSIMHQLFALKDLEKNEDIMDYRGKEGSFGMYMFPVNNILDSLIQIHPNDCKLYKGLGDYYNEVHLKYGGRWLKNDNELFALMTSNYKKVIDSNCADYLTYYGMGYIAISQEKYTEGIPYFLKSIQLNKDYVSSYYNVAVAYMFTNNPKYALKYAKISLDLYTDQTYKGDAARMMGQLYSELKDDQKALEHFELANKIDANNYSNIKALLNIYVKISSPKIKETMLAFFNLAPDNPTIYNDMDDIFYQNKKENELLLFYTEQLKRNQEKPAVLGSLNFYSAKLYISSDKKLAKEHFLKAKDIFSKVYEKNHPVFQAIDEGIKQTE